MIRRGQVVAVHPESRTVDLVMLDDGQRMARVEVMAGASDCGVWDVPSVKPPANEAAAGGMATSGRTLHAVLAPDGRGSGVVLGFVAPMGGLAVKEQDRYLYRHPSGAAFTIAPDGSIEVIHPSGSYFRMGTGDHQDLAGVVTSALPAAGGPVPQITMGTPDGVKLTVKPGGEVELTTPAELKLTYAHATLHGDIALTGTLTASVDVVANGISLHNHKHGGVAAGAAQTGVPV